MAEIGDLKLPPLKALEKGIFDTYKYTVLTFSGFYNLIKDLFTGHAKEAAKNLTGPIGIFSLVGEAKNEGLGSLLAFMALISINLAVLNILPLPALDGGRILFVLIETLTRKPLSQNAQAYINGIFFFLLISLMVLVTIKDVIKYF